MKIKSARSRSAAAIVASMALMGAGAALTTAPAQSAAPAGDCAAPYPVAGLTAGAAVTGLTVSKGTTPEGFTGEVLGVIEGGIAPGLDMIMAELSSPAIDGVGIWQGMSGSPVYAADGRLIGAVAYGLSFGPSPVAGITPFEDMDDYFAATAPAKVRVGKRVARSIAAETGVSRTQARQGFRQLPMPVALSGITQHRLRKMRKKGPDYLHTRGVTASGAASSASAATPDSLVAGGNLGAAMSYGDITAGGVGTVTSVCEGRLIGFGHPMNFQGRTTLGLMPAEAVYVQGDPAGPGFKVANMGVPAGTINQDRLTGISGSVGAVPAETDVTSTVTYGPRTRTGESHALVPVFNADVTFSQLLANHDRVVDAIQPGSEVAAYAITGTGGDGQPFDLQFSDRYTSRYDISFESIFEVTDLVYMLSQMRGVDIDDIEATADVTDETAMWRIRKVQQRRGGTWVGIGRRTPAVAKAGKALRLRATLVSGSRTKAVRLKVAVPRRSKRRGYLDVRGGASLWDDAVYRAKSPADLEDAVANMVRNDQVQASLRFVKRGKDIVRTKVSATQDMVVNGGKWAEVRVRR